MAISEARLACQGCQADQMGQTSRIASELHMIPSHPDEVATVARGLSAERGDQMVLKEAIAPIRTGHGFVLLDCPPSLSLLTISAPIAADAVLVPVPTELLSLGGVAQLLHTVEIIRDRFNPALRIPGVLPVRYEVKPRGAQVVLKRLGELGVPVFNTRVGKTVTIADAPGARPPITLYDASSRGARDYRELAREVLACVAQTSSARLRRPPSDAATQYMRSSSRGTGGRAWGAPGSE